MIYIIPCSTMKLIPESGQSARLEKLSYNDELLAARTELISLSNAAPDWSNTYPAWKLFASKTYPRPVFENWLKTHNVRIVSALFGLLNKHDFVPYYQLGMNDSLPNGQRVYEFWREKKLLQQLIPEFGVDLLTTNYRKAFNAEGEEICVAPTILEIK